VFVVHRLYPEADPAHSGLSYNTLLSDRCHSRGTGVALAHSLSPYAAFRLQPIIEPSCISGVVDVTEVSMGWWDIPLEGHPMSAERYFMAVAVLLLLLFATFSFL